ncbi:MAG: efflux transporter outer membrane subunit [Deltaproteobacteria bacterium]|nr:MAG: efflux transporter outer membrane subunit [Deltaproteobacteria bacterium]
MKKKLILYLGGALAISLSVSGCFKMGPDYHRPDTDFQVPAHYQYTPTELVMPEPDDQWWRVFNDPELNQLVEQVLKNNLDIKRATAAVLEVRAQLVSTRADRFPQVDAQGQAERQQLPKGTSVDRTFTSYDLALPASFEIDLWGRLARAEEAARANLLRAEENRRTVAQTVVAETVTLYLQMESFERAIDIDIKLIESFRRSLNLVESRYKRGLTSVLDVRQARRVLAGAEATLPSLRQDLGTTQQALAVLLGRYPETRPPRLQPEDYYKRLDPVPPGLPSDLLLRRPDIRAAEEQLVALNALVGAAKASRFPRIVLTGTYGYTSDDLDRLFKPENELWSIAAGIAQPLFDAGKLRAAQRAAEARYQQGVAEYAKTVLSAFAEVEGAFLTREEQLKRREYVVTFLHEAREAQRIAESRYEKGLTDFLTVLDTQRTRFEAERDLLQVDFTLLNNRVNLHRALGGGWGDPGPVMLGQEGQTEKNAKGD